MKKKYGQCKTFMILGIDEKEVAEAKLNNDVCIPDWIIGLGRNEAHDFTDGSLQRFTLCLLQYEQLESKETDLFKYISSEAGFGRKISKSMLSYLEERKLIIPIEKI